MRLITLSVMSWYLLRLRRDTYGILYACNWYTIDVIHAICIQVSQLTCSMCAFMLGNGAWLYNTTYAYKLYVQA